MKQQKQRDHNRLRKLVAPKHALLAINEIKGVTISNFTYTMVSTNPIIFEGAATINEVAYKGRGSSKNAAKTDVCDQAMRDIIIRKMWAQSKAIDEERELPPDEEIPIVPLVSYAIHKLFADWEAEGYCMKCAGNKSMDPYDPCICNGAVRIEPSPPPGYVEEEEDDQKASDDECEEEAPQGKDTEPTAGPSSSSKAEESEMPSTSSQ